MSGLLGPALRTHIRGAWVDYLVEDALGAFNAPLHDNLVVSPVTGSCPSVPVGGWPDTCASLEDLRYPDIAAVDSFGALVVCEQKLDYDPAGNTEIAGRALLPPVAANDATACVGADLGTSRDSALQLIVHLGQTVLARVSRYGYGNSTGAQFLVNNSFEVLVDSDEDGYADIADNCSQVVNADQRDTDYDGYGNACDGDLDNSGGVVNFGDLATFKFLFGQPPGPFCCAL